ncbi:MAG: DUF4105 domain-containing protein [Flavobacteriaceae bacterium]|nr:DUF4105 domain-containing protein [Bacteroidia bacterium]NNL59805.1 DUF4105 domain-containing protein [Flavobacteriaceae bacterium]
MKKYFFLLSWILCISNSFSQYLDLSQQAEISVLTIGPGSSLNDSFGHSAFRVKDRTKNLDIIFNYGVYDFEAENFYLKFARGKLNYIVDVSNYEAFKNYYIRQNRWIKEQVLDLSNDNKQKVFDFLANNSEPENKFYLYDFFFDNCATKMKDVLTDGVGLVIDFENPKDFEAKTFRELIQKNLNWNSWGSLGIDIALGSVIDKTALPEEHMFLPEYIYHFFENATIADSNDKPLVRLTKDVFVNQDKAQEKQFFLSPIIVLGILSVIILFFTIQDYKKGTRSKTLDIILFFISGAAGIILLLLWLATDHSATAQNYNLLWAFAVNLFVLGQVYKNEPKNWFIRYLKFLLIMLCLLLLQWVVGMQRFAFALMPFLIALAVRYTFLIYHFNQQKS